MRTLFKYLLHIIIVFIFVLAYTLFTESGKKNLYTILSLYSTHKAGIDIDITNISLRNLPYIEVNASVEQVYTVHIDGFLKMWHADLNYTINAHCLKSNLCNFDDTIAIKGKMTGWRKHILFTGKGKVLEGDINYTFIKERKKFKDIRLTLHDINSSKFFQLFKQKAYLNGKANMIAHFVYWHKKERKGIIDYNVYDHHFYGVASTFKTHIQVNNHTYQFHADINTSHAQLHLQEGKYNQRSKQGSGLYRLDIDDLKRYKKLLGGKYRGQFHAIGKMDYNKSLQIDGFSKDLGGTLFFSYLKKQLHIQLDNVSSVKLMRTLAIKPIINANLIGNVTYDTKNKSLKLKTKLKQAKLLPSRFTHTIQKKFAFHLTKQVFNKSALTLSYQDKVLSSHLRLANDKMYLILTDTKLNTQGNAIDTNIKFHAPKYSLEGKFYARADTIGAKSLDDIYIKYDGFIKEYYKIKLDGLVSDAFINMDYSLSAKRLPSHICTIEDDINLTGHLSGTFNRLHIQGSGMAMEGHVRYSAIKIKNRFEDMVLKLDNIHTLKLFTLFGQPKFPNGKANISIHFDYWNSKTKQGNIQYVLTKGKYHTVPLVGHANLKVHNNHIAFTSNIHLANTEINISKGQYHEDTHFAKAFYTLKSKKLSSLKPLIGEYIGHFSALGEITYNQHLQVRGLSKTFGGSTDFLYKNDMLYVDLEHVSLECLMQLFPYPHILTSDINGHINYDTNSKKVIFQADMNNTRFLASDIVQKVYKTSGINMRKEVFPNSKLRIKYQDKILTGAISLQNNQSHFHLNDVTIDKKRDTIYAYFDLKIQAQAFSGKIHGPIKHPKIDIDMQKLLRYQMDKQLDSVIGKSNRKLMENMPMGDTAKDMASEFGAGFMKIFF